MKGLKTYINEGIFDVDATITKALDDDLLMDLNWINDPALKKLIGGIVPAKSSRSYNAIFKWAEGLKGSDLAELYKICHDIEKSSLSADLQNDVFDAVEDELEYVCMRIGYIRMLEPFYAVLSEIDKIIKKSKDLKVKEAELDFSGKGSSDLSEVTLYLKVDKNKMEEWKHLLEEIPLKECTFRFGETAINITCDFKDTFLQSVIKAHKFRL